jgi:glycosyltransferase involved in cell wall biosynthesis
VELPKRTSARLRLAVTGSPPGELSSRGWEVICGWKASESIDAYRAFIQQSRGEFGIAKHGYVASRCGWFSDRSVCYLASGRPVIVQDTGLGDWLPLGHGVLAFTNLDQAVNALEEVEGDYETHRRAARRIAEDHFDARRTLSALLEIALA